MNGDRAAAKPALTHHDLLVGGRWWAARLADVPGEAIQLSHAPVGVVGAICPWNFPLAVLCRKLGPALITGNTVVMKPSEISPLSTIELFRLFDAELDLPPGVINLVTGGRPDRAGDGRGPADVDGDVHRPP